MNQLTANESQALIWAFVGLVAILVTIGWYYIQSSLKSQNKMSEDVFAIRLNQAESNKDLQMIKDDMQEVKEDVQILTVRQNELEKDLILLSKKSR